MYQRKEVYDVTSKEMAKLSGYFIYFFIGGLIALFAFLAYFSAQILETFQIDDVPNLTAMIFELGIGIVITLVVYYYSKRSEKRLEEALEKIDKKLEKF